MPQPLYMSNDGTRVGTISAMRAYESEVGAPLSNFEEQHVIEMVQESDADFSQPAATRHHFEGGIEVGSHALEDFCERCVPEHLASSFGRENRPLIAAVQKAVIEANRGLVGRKKILQAWGAVDAEFRRIYGDPD